MNNMNINNIIGKRLRDLRIQSKLEQKEVAEFMGYKSDTTISKWENGKNLPNGGKLAKLAQLFNTTTDYILYGNNKNNNTTAPTISFPTINKDTDTLTQITSISATLVDFRQRKVLDYATAQKREQDSKIREENVTYISDYIEAKREGFVAAGTGQYVLDDHKEMVTIPSSILPKKSYDLMLQVKGDSMLPTFKDDEFVFVKKSTDIHNGQFGVFRINNESYIKKVYIENERLKLVSLNPSYPDLFFDETDDIELVGVVVM